MCLIRIGVWSLQNRIWRLLQMKTVSFAQKCVQTNCYKSKWKALSYKSKSKREKPDPQHLYLLNCFRKLTGLIEKKKISEFCCSWNKWIKKMRVVSNVAFPLSLTQPRRTPLRIFSLLDKQLCYMTSQQKVPIDIKKTGVS